MQKKNRLLNSMIPSCNVINFSPTVSESMLGKFQQEQPKTTRNSLKITSSYAYGPSSMVNRDVMENEK